jgi:erythromycin esterase-like protein
MGDGRINRDPHNWRGLVLAAIAAAMSGGATPGAAGPARQDGAGVPALIRSAAQPVRLDSGDYRDITTAAAGSSRVLLGESTHGTHEYYRERARITEMLVREHDVRAVAIEGDWGATDRVNLYVRGLGTDRSAGEALGSYKNFPQWMWRNAEFRDFIERLRAINLARPPRERVGVYGMDVYDLFDAADAVVAHLERTDRAAAGRLRGHYRCFSRHRRSIDDYAAALRRDGRSCQSAAEAALRQVEKLPASGDPVAAEQRFAIIRAAASVASAEAYFRTSAMGSYAWNVRDRQMERNVEAIARHVQALSGQPGKVVMWAHNSHVGDARATDMAARGELNLGQLMRQRHGDRAFLVGFLTHEGTVMAAPQWDEPARRYDVRPALAGSHAALFRRVALPAFSLVLRGHDAVSRALAGPMLQRAIGVVYRPETERQSHYFEARLPQQFDAVIFFDTTHAVEPLSR